VAVKLFLGQLLSDMFKTNESFAATVVLMYLNTNSPKYQGYSNILKSLFNNEVVHRDNIYLNPS
jgi:hypothetical protein